MKNKKVLSTFIIIGAVMVIASLVTRIYADKTIAGVLFGLGFTLFGLSLSKILSVSNDEKHPELAALKTIEINDERNVLIRHKAQAKAGRIQQYILIAFAYLLMVIDAPLYQIFLIVAIYLCFTLLTSYYYNYYQKRM